MDQDKNLDEEKVTEEEIIPKNKEQFLENHFDSFGYEIYHPDEELEEDEECFVHLEIEVVRKDSE